MVFSIAKLILFYSENCFLLGAGLEMLSVDGYEANMNISRHLGRKNSNNWAGGFPEKNPDVTSPYID